MGEQYKVVIWDKQADAPYHVLWYDELDDATEVARNMRRHYIEDWGGHAESMYLVKLQKVGESA